MATKEPPPTTEDGHFIVVSGRRWRATDPMIPEAVAAVIRQALLTARRDVGRAQRSGHSPASARTRVLAARVALGERGEPWWDQTPEQRQQRWEHGLRTLSQAGPDRPTLVIPAAGNQEMGRPRRE